MNAGRTPITADMSDCLWDRLCTRPIPDRYAPIAARARANLAAAWDALTTHEQDAAAEVLNVEDDFEVLSRLSTFGSALYRAVLAVRGLTVLCAPKENAGAPRRKKWGGAPLEYEHVTCELVLERLTA